MISTSQNIKENMWEFGVLRSLGLRKTEVERVYLYEAISVTFSSIVLGIIVGLIMAIMMAL